MITRTDKNVYYANQCLIHDYGYTVHRLRSDLEQMLSHSLHLAWKV